MHPVLDSAGVYSQPINHPHFPALHHPASAADTASLYHHHHQQHQQQHLQTFAPNYNQQHNNYVSSAVAEGSYSTDYPPIHGLTSATPIPTSKPQIAKSNAKSSPTTSVLVFPSPPAAASIKFESTAAVVSNSQQIKPNISSAANSPDASVLATSTTTTSTKSALDSTLGTLEFPQQQSASGKLITTSKNLRNVAAQQQTTSSSSLLSANNSAVAAAYYAAAIANPDTTATTNFYSNGSNYFNGTDSLIPEGLSLPPYYSTNPSIMMHGYGIGPDDLMNNISPLYAGSGLSNSTAHLHYESESSGSYGGWPQYYMESSSIPLTSEKSGDPSGPTMGTQLGSQLLPSYMDVRNDFYANSSLQQGINQSNIDPFPTVLPGVLAQGNPAADNNNHIYGNFPDSATTSALQLHAQPQHLMSLDQQFTPNYVDPMHHPTVPVINPYDSNCGGLSTSLSATSTAYVSSTANQLELLQPANSKLSSAPTPGKIKGTSSGGSTRRHRSTTKRSAAVITPDSRSGGGVADKSASSTSTSGWPHNFSNLSGHSSSLSPTGSSGMAKMPRKSRSRSSAMNKDDSELGDDDLGSNEDKEMDRRMANNTRERIRVRDINQAFKELAKLCSQHMPNTEERGLTKLGTLLKAVDLIPMLEEKVRARNLDPRMATMKRSNQNHQSMALSNSSFPLGVTDIGERAGGAAAKLEQTNTCALNTNQQML